MSNLSQCFIIIKITAYSICPVHVLLPFGFIFIEFFIVSFYFYSIIMCWNFALIMDTQKQNENKKETEEKGAEPVFSRWFTLTQSHTFHSETITESKQFITISIIVVYGMKFDFVTSCETNFLLIFNACGLCGHYINFKIGNLLAKCYNSNAQFNWIENILIVE